MNIEALKTTFIVLGSSFIVIMLVLGLAFLSVFLFGSTIWAVIFGGIIEFVAAGIFLYKVLSH